MEIIRSSGVYTLRLFSFSLSGLLSLVPDCLPCIFAFVYGDNCSMKDYSSLCLQSLVR
ncbi:hypothetical protein ASPVEDRAFT_696103 [Aspergillus versicolor CBS 583.65]|uniref:Uncharacterized protein n=1 Tax=Aspergillus versicolor CBS 583.65 TaxID=1036611 RepID=A0A1L9PMP6_ASPVE|nr:uncharacterized protein ASPVEDRAFT_696103 [Aspergillus versicolor CBS 583.65]OJJ02800.1 hypothetical protein ASPVEDRAFT_696103 [Aspergillus versicolor CBS 583.65]